MMNIQITVLKLFFPPACQQWRYGEFFSLLVSSGDMVIWSLIFAVSGPANGLG
jgi:hypothetical protein